MKQTRFTKSQIMAVLKEGESGVSALELCRKHGMSGAISYKWRAKYGGMDALLIKHMKELEAENQRPKKIYAESQMDAEILKEALAGKY